MNIIQLISYYCGKVGSIFLLGPLEGGVIILATLMYLYSIGKGDIK